MAMSSPLTAESFLPEIHSYQIRLITVSLCNSELASQASCVRHSSVTLSVAKGLSRWAQRCFAALSMTMSSDHQDLISESRNARGAASCRGLGGVPRTFLSPTVRLRRRQVMSGCQPIDSCFFSYYMVQSGTWY